MIQAVIKTGFCVAYDWQLLRNSIPRIYESSDTITLSIDKDRKSWSGNKYQFDEVAFRSFVAEIDTHNKIAVVEENFSSPKRNARQNCNYQRNVMSEKMGAGGWILQLDADEYFLDFDGFVKYLRRLRANPQPSQKAINVCCPFTAVIKKLSSGYLVVDYRNQLPEIIPIATNRPDYERSRQNGHFNHLTNFRVIHDTWSRDDNEMSFKVNNWGHSSEELDLKVLQQSYYNLWKVLDQFNYQYVFDIHPAKREIWPALKFIPASNISELIKRLTLQKQVLSSFQLIVRNSRTVARGIHLLDKLKSKK